MNKNKIPPLISLEICAGAGGQALGLERAGFSHHAVVELDEAASRTLAANRPAWGVVCQDVRTFRADGDRFQGIDLLAGGVPCPPYSIAGKQLGDQDERDLFPEALRLVREVRPRALMIENVKGLKQAKFDGYRSMIEETLDQLGYRSFWKLIHASDYGVPQLRPRFLLVALQHTDSVHFTWPTPRTSPPPTVGEALRDLMGAGGWQGVDAWAAKACDIAPTIVGGSKKHGGADLGPTRAKRQWLALGVDGKGIAESPPDAATPVHHVPRLTLPMVARLQGFPDDWAFQGKKTAAYRQIGNAFPPPVAEAVGLQIQKALRRAESAAPRMDLVDTPLFGYLNRLTRKYGRTPAVSGRRRHTGA